MQYCFKFIPPFKSACHGVAIASLSFVLSIGTASVAQAQPATAYGELPPPPPLSTSSAYGRTQRGTYVLPGTRHTTSAVILPSPPREPVLEQMQPPVRLSGGTPPRRPAPRPSKNHEKPAPYLRAETPSTLRYATPPSASTRAYYPKPVPVQPAATQPLAPEVTPQVPIPAPAVAASPTVPFGTPSAPLQQEQPPAIAKPALTPVARPKPSKAIIQHVPIGQPNPQEMNASITPQAAEPEEIKSLPWEAETVKAPEPIISEPIRIDEKQEVLPAFEPLALPNDGKENISPVTITPPAAITEDIPPLPEVVELKPVENLTVQSVEVPKVSAAEPPALSEESREILSKTPSGIDSKVIARSPKPVVIKRTAPNAGNIPAVDVRTHEEMGMKIEIRKADINVHEYLEQGYENLIAGHEAIAAGYYSEALAAEPANELALFGLATTYQRMGNTAEARDLYGKLLAINPTHREALNNFMALISNEAPQDAIEELEKLETENPDFSPIPAQLGIVYKKIGDNNMAVTKLVRALQLSPDNVSYKYNLAVTLDAMGKRREAAEMYMELIEDYNNGATIPGDIVTIRNRAIFLNAK